MQGGEWLVVYEMEGSKLKSVSAHLLRKVVATVTVPRADRVAPAATTVAVAVAGAAAAAAVVAAAATGAGAGAGAGGVVVVIVATAAAAATATAVIDVVVAVGVRARLVGLGCARWYVDNRWAISKALCRSLG